MPVFIVIIHIVVCIALILIVLLQTGKGADMGAAFGGGASQTLFGTTGASTFLSKATTAAAVIFMLTSLTLAYMADNSGNARLVTEPPTRSRTVPQTAPGTVPPATKQSPAAQSQTQGQPVQQSAPAAPQADQTAKPAHNQGQTKP
jgi:preprotein translocase subunit SecG